MSSACLNPNVLSEQLELRAVALLMVALSALTGCATPVRDGPAVRNVSLMAFNVENLFDTEDAVDKDDATYLPIARKMAVEHIEGCNQIEVDRWRDQCLNWDWNERVLDVKLRVIGAAIRAATDDGRGPDVIALQEVENVEILERLRREHLRDSGYGPPILVEGDDARGIDVAFLTRLPVVGDAALHPIRFADDVPEARVADTRGILEATFELPDGSLLTGYSVHFPAPFHPTAMRESAYRSLNALLDALPRDRYAFAAGDFNTTSLENQREDLLGRYARPNWQLAHETIDLRSTGGCHGTSYYARDDSWSYLDMVLWATPREIPGRSENATWRLREGSARCANSHPEQVTERGTPNRFAMPAATGVSDHWPFYVEIEIE